MGSTQNLHIVSGGTRYNTEHLYISCGTRYDPKQIATSPVYLGMLGIHLTHILYVPNMYPYPNGYDIALFHHK
eukprot:8789001-Ditylum_brightwellii.AAC.2